MNCFDNLVVVDMLFPIIAGKPKNVDGKRSVSNLVLKNSGW